MALAVDALRLPGKFCLGLAQAPSQCLCLFLVSFPPCSEIGDEEMHALAAVLRKNPSITELNIRMNSVTDEGARALAAVLAGSSRLRKVDLRQNNIGKSGVRAIAEALERSERVRHVYVHAGGKIEALGTGMWAAPRDGVAGDSAAAAAAGGASMVVETVCGVDVRDNTEPARTDELAGGTFGLTGGLGGGGGGSGTTGGRTLSPGARPETDDAGGGGGVPNNSMRTTGGGKGKRRKKRAAAPKRRPKDSKEERAERNAKREYRRMVRRRRLCWWCIVVLSVVVPHLPADISLGLCIVAAVPYRAVWCRAVWCRAVWCGVVWCGMWWWGHACMHATQQEREFHRQREAGWSGRAGGMDVGRATPRQGSRGTATPRHNNSASLPALRGGRAHTADSRPRTSQRGMKRSVTSASAREGGFNATVR